MAVLQVVMRYGHGATLNIMQNTHYAVGATLDGSDLAGFATIIRNAMNSRLANRLPQSFTLYAAQGRVVSTQGLPFADINLTAITGADASAIMPLRLSVLVQYQRMAASPNRKRTYLGFWAEGQNDGGVPVSGLISDINLFNDDLLNFTTINGKPAAYAVGRYTGTPPYMPTAYELESYQTVAQWASLRSRRS